MAITIYQDESALPPQPAELSVGPTLIIELAYGSPSKLLYIQDHTSPTSLPWQLEVSEPWLEVSATSGTTPATITVSIKETMLDWMVVRVSVTIAPYYQFLPMISRWAQGVCNGRKVQAQPSGGQADPRQGRGHP